MNGLLLIDKERGISSYDVIRRLKRLLPRGTKIGHAGTLDPFATGLLIVMIGRSTKLNDSLHLLNKGYKVTAEFGYETDTQDPEGQVIKSDLNLKQFSRPEINEILTKFKGEVLQMPPQYSAKKVSGKKAYELARDGKEVKLEAKEVTIHKLELSDYNWPFVTFSCEVSTGTYIRTLVVDIAHALNTFANSVELRRTYIGDLKVENAIPSSAINESIEIEKNLIHEFKING